MKHPMIALTALALMLAPAAAVAGQGTASQGPQVNVDEQTATVEYERTVDDMDASFEIAFSTTDTTFENTLSVQSGDLEANETFEQQYHQLVEYRDDNNNGQYDDGEPVVSSFLMSEDSEEVAAGPVRGTVQWDELETADASTDDGEPGQRIIARGELAPTAGDLPELPDPLDPNENGTVGLDIYVFGDDATYNDTEVRATEVKVDLTVKDYPYAENGTALALIQESTVPTQDQDIQADQNEGVEGTFTVSGVEIGLSYTWLDEATVDGATEPVRTTILENGTQEETSSSSGEGQAASHTVRQTQALSYVRGDVIVHDPATGATFDAPGNVGDDLADQAQDVPGPGALALLAASGLAAGVAALHRR